MKMGIIFQWFQHNLDMIFFIFGLTFVLFGIILTVVGLLKIFNLKAKEKLDDAVNIEKSKMKELQETSVSRTYMNNIIDSMIDTLVVLTPRAAIMTVNRAACNLLDYKEEELIGKPIDIIFDEKVFFKGDSLAELFKNGSLLNIEKTYLSKDDRKIPMVCSISILHDKGGNIDGIVCVGQDVTERKMMYEQLEASLFESNQKSVYIENIIASIIDSIIVVDLECIIIKTNNAACSILGYKDTELLGQSIGLVFEDELKEGIYDLMTVGSVERSYRTKAGLSIPVLFSGSILSDSNGKVIGLACVAQDITKIKNLEKELKEHVTHMEDMVAERTSEIVKVNKVLECSLSDIGTAKAFSENIINSMFEILIILDKDEKIVEVNPAALKALGFSQKELIGLYLHELVPFEEKKFLSSFINQELKIHLSPDDEKETLSKSGTISKIETIMVSKDGKNISVILSASLMRNESDGTLEGIICTASDITTRKKMEDNIRNNYQLQSAINSLLIIGFNDNPLSEQLNDALKIILDKFTPQLTQGAIFMALPEDEVLYMEAQANLPDALVSMCSKVSFGNCLCGKAARTNQLIFTDHIDDQHENQFENITPHGHYCVPISKGEKVLGIIMLHLTIGHEKSKAEEIFLISAARTLAEIIVRRQSEKQLKEAKDILELKNDELNIAYDKLKHAQVKLIHNEKMASIGTLAAGVAHEINNPLAFIISNLNTLTRFEGKINKYLSELKYLTLDMDNNVNEPIRTLEKSSKIDFVMENFGGLLEDSIDGAERIKKIVIGLQGFARKDAFVQEYADINEGIEKTLSIVWNRLKYKVNVIKEYGELPKIKCYVDQLNQVFMNLLVNAADAIENKGDIKISTFKSNGHINVSISDTGSGISDENLKDIFSPFFTTKEVGKGTGLGLSISYDIVKEHKGDIEVKSEIGVGTTFIIKIPIET
jgi:PAS domain S-box-containing protein